MGKPIEEVTIVGGGTAGWMTALILQSLLQKNPESATVKRIKLIESPNIPTVGVGEATVPGMPRTLRLADISEREFFRRCNASFKLGVVFDGWNVDRAGKPIKYVNPFSSPPAIQGHNMAIFYAQHGAKDVDYVQTFSPAVDAWKSCKGPRALGAKPFDSWFGYAYHLDAGLFAKMLCEICTERGVEHVLDDVVDVEQDERGYIAAVHLKETGRHPTELVIDCTGFRGLIVNQVLKEPFVDYSKYLGNDRALAVQIPHKPGAKIEPVTRSTALGAGWSWRVPLFNRIGTGYVYSSAHRSDDEAREEFLTHLGPDHKDADPRVIPMRIGRNRTNWVKNCVAIGLSGGFIEPLESTAIHMIEMGVRYLTAFFPSSDFEDPIRDRYNRKVGELFDEVRDFICLHYALGNRTDSQYWIDARTELEVPDSLAENLELWKYQLAGAHDLKSSHLFDHHTYNAVLLGKQVYQTGYGAGQLNPAITLPKRMWQNQVKHARKTITALIAQAPDHKALIQDIRGDAPVPFAMATAGPTVQVPGSTGFGKIKMPEPDMGPSGESNLL